MTTIEDVYNRFISSDEQVRTQMLEAVKTPEGLASLLAENGCDAAPEEFLAYLQERMSATGELDDAELEFVSGGCSETTQFSIATFGIGYATGACN